MQRKVSLTPVLLFFNFLICLERTQLCIAVIILPIWKLVNDGWIKLEFSLRLPLLVALRAYKFVFPPEGFALSSQYC